MKRLIEKQLDAFLQVPGYIFWKDRNDRLQGCNQDFADLLGVSPKEIIGKSFSDLREDVDAGLLNCYQSDDQSVIQSGLQKCYQEHFVDSYGNIHPVITRKRPLFDEMGEIIGVISVSIQQGKKDEVS